MDDSDASPRVRFERVGLGHADGRMRQVLEQDVTDYSSLRLLVTLQIASQSLDVCGNRGSECPLTIQLDYEDQNGAARSWQQGFYAVGTPGPTCPMYAFSVRRRFPFMNRWPTTRWPFASRPTCWP